MKRKNYLLTLLFAIIIGALSTANSYAQKTEKKKTKAQIRKEQRLEKEIAQAAFVDSLLECRHFNFVAERSVANMTGSGTFSLNYGVTIEGEKVYSKLPFFGKMNTAIIGASQGPLDFESLRISYEQVGQPKGKRDFAVVTIGIQPTSGSNLYKYVFEIYSSGSATLTVAQQNGDGAAFYGYITNVDSSDIK